MVSTFCNQTARLLMVMSLFFVFSCGEKKQETEESKEPKEEKKDVNKDIHIKFDNEVYSVPSPFQMSSIFKKSGGSYNQSLLNSTGNLSKYTTNFSQALNLGIYAADLGYIRMYDQTQDMISYFNACKELADGLGILAAFEMKTVERFKANLDKPDSLLYIISESMRASETYLKENERKSLASLVLAGGWVEGLYLATRMVKGGTGDPKVIEHVGVQKISLGNLIPMLNKHRDETGFPALVNSLKDLQTKYEPVEIKYTYVAPQTDTSKHMTTINSKSEVIATADQLTAIANAIESIRNQISN